MIIKTNMYKLLTNNRATTSKQQSDKKHKKRLRASRQQPSNKRICDNIADFVAWKKRASVGRDQRVFTIVGYPSIRQALLERGWFEQTNIAFLQWEFCFTMNWRSIPMNILREDQVVNHFGNCGPVSTKAGLCRNLQASQFHHRCVSDTFYPVCRVLNERSGELRDWIGNDR